jgi:sugar lactone lactonase YvrE
LPVNGALATSQSLNPTSVAPDRAGGFYFSSEGHHQIYYVSSDGRLRLVAGNGSYGYSGDGGPAISAKLREPTNLALDSQGNLYIGECKYNHIRKVTPAGIITTVAGNGIYGFRGDGGQANLAQLARPRGIAVDSAGNLYIADTENCRIRKVSTSGVITTVAGNGYKGYSGDDGPATSAQIAWPYGVAVDSKGNVYIAEHNNHRIRKVSRDGIITTIAGVESFGYSGDNGKAASAQFYLPSSIALGHNGSLYIADSGNLRIRKITPAGVITTVIGNGTHGYSGDGGRAASAQLERSFEIAVDSKGNLYLADTWNNRIRKVNADGIITTVAGNGILGLNLPLQVTVSTGDSMTPPEGIAVNSLGELYMAENRNHRIRKMTPSGTLTTVAGNWEEFLNGDAYQIVSEIIHKSNCSPLDSAGNYYYAETVNHRIQKNHTVSGKSETITVAGNGTAGYSGDGGQAPFAQLNKPGCVALDSANNLYIADTENNRIRKVTPGGIITSFAGNGTKGFSGDGEQATMAQLESPLSITFDYAGALYIAENGNNRIRKVTPNGIITTYAENRNKNIRGDSGQTSSILLKNPMDISLDPAGNIYIADSDRIYKVDVDGAITTVAGNREYGFSGDGGKAILAQLNGPRSLEFDSAGNLYIADTGNSRIRKITTDGVITTVAGDGNYGYGGDGGQATAAQLNDPYDIAVDPAGNLYIADTENNRVRKVSPAGVITTVAGNGTRGYSGDGGQAVSAQLNHPEGIAVDTVGNLYIADTWNHRIRKVEANGAIATVAGDKNEWSFGGDGGQAISASLYYPGRVVIDTKGNLYIAEAGDPRFAGCYLGRIRKITPAGLITTVAGIGIGGSSRDNGDTITRY